MGQAANVRREGANEAKAAAKYLSTSPRKLNLVAQMIRGKNASRALVDLEFCPRRIAKDVKKILQAAVANAENNHGLDVDRLFVAEASVGKAITMKRMRARAKGRGSRIEKPFSRLVLIVREREEEIKAAKVKPVKADKKDTGADKPEKVKSASAAPKKAPKETKVKNSEGAKAAPEAKTETGSE